MPVLIRVPEAYLLLKEFGATRPGLLVLDSDGRRIDGLALAGQTPASVALWLGKAETKVPRERSRIRVSSAGRAELEKLKKSLSSLRGVHEVTIDRAELIVKADPGALPPGDVRDVAKKAGLAIEILEPVRVRLKPKVRAAPTPLGTVARVPGVWYVSYANPPTAWVTRFLLDPHSLAKAAPQHETGIKSRRYTFKDAPKGGRGATLARAPLSVAGVLAVVPDIYSNAVTVVGRTGFDDARVRASFAATGSEPEK